MSERDRTRRTAIQRGDVEQRFPHIDLSNPFFRAAMEYAYHGWAVFPLGARSKVPAGGHGYLDATTDIDQIRRWWARTPNANIGIATRANGLLVIDVDPKNRGDETLSDIEKRHGTLPDTVEAITGSGGRHLFFEAPIPDAIVRKSNALGNGIDFPNYVVAAPSIHPDTGRAYAWEVGSHPEDISIAPLPEWVVALSTPQPLPDKPQPMHGGWQPGYKPGRVSKRTEDFIQHGAPLGDQRWRALAATRNLLVAGNTPEQVANLVWAGLQASQWEKGRSPWTFRDALGIALDLAAHPRAASFPNIRAENATPARIEDSIRAGVAFLEHELDTTVEQKETSGALAVARRAALASIQYREWADESIPLLPGMRVRAGGAFMRRKDNPLHCVANGGASDTWQEEGNAVLKRRRALCFYIALLFDIVEAEDQGAIYQYGRHLSPEIWKENEAWVRRLRARIRRHHKNYVEFIILKEDGLWLYVFSDYDDPRGDTEPTVADRDDLAPLLVGLRMAEAEYHRKSPVHASKAWAMLESRTGDWQILGSRNIPDLMAYREVEDAYDAQIAIESGIATYRASEEEVMGRAPEAIQHTRHFIAPPEMQPWQMLEFAADLGFYLFPKIQAELDQAKSQAKADARAKTRRAAPPHPIPIPQGELAF